MNKVHIKLNKKNLILIGASIEHGQEIMGVSESPKIFREMGLIKVIEDIGWDIIDKGDINERTVIEQHELHNFISDTIKRTLPVDTYNIYDIMNCDKLAHSCSNLFHIVAHSLKFNKFILTLGGDHSIAVSTISGMLTHHPNLRVIWVDAHADINTPDTSTSKHYHGMPVAHLLGWFKKRVPGFDWLEYVPCLPEDHLAYIGLRDIDLAEKKLLANSKIHRTSMNDIDYLGIHEVITRILKSLDPDDLYPIHLSLDIDSCDPSVAPGTGTKARGGLTYREVRYLCECIHATGRLISMDLVEVNVTLDKQEEHIHGNHPLMSPETPKTVRLAVDLIAASLGKTLL